jgi:hypothetical protein
MLILWKRVLRGSRVKRSSRVSSFLPLALGRTKNCFRPQFIADVSIFLCYLVLVLFRRQPT